MRPFKAVQAPPFDGKPTWHGLYHRDGKWREVRNLNDGIIAYASAQAAIGGAKLMLKQYPNGQWMFAPSGMMLDEKGNRSIFCDVDD